METSEYAWRSHSTVGELTLKDGCFEGVGFHPWIGERYCANDRFGVRVLVLGESHYGQEGNETSDETKGVVETFTQRARTGRGERLRFFTVVANILRGQRGWIDDSDLAEVFQEIAFYNFVQTFVGDGPRGDPTFRQWVDAQAPLKTVLQALRPDAVLVLGLELWEHILDWPEDIDHAVIAHPSSSHCRYEDVIPAFHRLVQRAKTGADRDV